MAASAAPRPIAGEDGAAERPRGTGTPQRPGSRLASRLKRALLIAAMAAASMNMFTGGPLLALWIGSRLQGASQQPTMGPVFVVAAAFGGFSYGLLRMLRWLGTRYDALAGRPPTIRKHMPWLRSMRGERPREAGDDYSLSALEIVLCVMVFIALAAFEYWFFFLSTSSIDQRTGRS